MKKSRILKFKCRGEWYKVRENGDMLQEGNTYNEWGGDWRFLGVSFHHWSGRLDKTVEDAFKDPQSIVKGLVWDVDHGTTRKWGGRWNGKLPRVDSAYIEEGK